MSVAQRLLKIRAKFNRGLSAIIPGGGTSGQTLSKLSNSDFDYGWVTPEAGAPGEGTGLPAGGTTGQVLRKASSTDGDASWAAETVEVPAGGTTGQALRKVSNDDGDVSWQDDPAAEGSVPVDGWSEFGVTATYASASSFTVPGDLTSTFTKGTKLRLVQTTTKYLYVVGSSHAGGTTTVTVTGGSDYSLANAAITSPYHSKFSAPNGFPHWFNFTPGITGFSSNPSNAVYRFRIEGATCFCKIRQALPGTSNATTFTITGAPVTAATVTNGSWFGAMWGQNGGVTAMHFIVIDSNTTTFHCATAAGGGTGWSNTGNKACHAAIISYEF